MPSTKIRIQYRYTPTGQRSSLLDPDGGRFTYSYDSVKRITRVINPQGERTSYSYDAVGRRTLKKLANGSRTSFSYDAAGQMTTVAHLKSNGAMQARYDYVYDEVGNRTRMSELDGSITTWSYDNLDQLTAEHRTGTNAYRNTYTYDNRGNRTLKNIGGQRTTSTYDDANQLQWSQDVSGRTTFTFDADGNQQVVLSPGGDRVTNLWDYENRLIGVLHPDGSRETMAYDPDGKRVKLQETASTTKYVWDDQNYLQETDASDVTQVTYTNEPRTYGNLISQRKSSASHYYLFDALGSTRLVTDASENVAESLLYDAWGNLVGSAPTMAVPFRWVGELGYLFVPATSDYYVRARVYQPGIGRWMSKDPLGLLVGLNLYRYALNQVSLSTDSTGGQPDCTADDECAAGAVNGPWHTNVVVKSFIVGPMAHGNIDNTRLGLSPLTPPWDLILYKPGHPTGARGRLRALWNLVKELPPFNENPSTDAMDGKYRLFTLGRLVNKCDCNYRPCDIQLEKTHDGGLEFGFGDLGFVPGPGGIPIPLPPYSIYGLMFSNIYCSRPSPNCVRIHIHGWGRPNPLVEPGMQWVAFRTSKNIWHRALVDVCCVDGKEGQVSRWSIVEFTGSSFPTHRIWVNGGDFEETLPQGTFSDLWEPHPNDPDFVDEGNWE